MSASHGGISIRRIFIFAVVTIVTSLLGLFALPQSTSAIDAPTSTQNYTVSNTPADEKTEAEIAAEKEAESIEKAGSCGVEGIGWIVCPITKALTGGMDWVYEVLCSMMAVQPVVNDNEGALFKAWSYMRSFANIAFVIAFLIIIYSQMTNYGINNYGIKKLLPRLIIAAILVNISYYICAIAVDVSNILGYSIQEAFLSIREGLMGADVNDISVPTWQSTSLLVLSGVGAGVGIWAAISTFNVAGAVLLFVPAVMACLLAVLMAFVVLTARQAIITILVIIAPLAFVAYLLPNTEKWFEKWKSTFLTLLILFPAFSVVFGGSQLASIAIIKNANSIQVLIMGLMVQIAPLMITPLLVKFSGNLLNKVGGFVNNPSKGLVDRVNNLAKDHRDTRAAKTLSSKAGETNLPLRARQKMDYNRRKREAQRKEYGNSVDSRFTTKYYNDKFKDPNQFIQAIEERNNANEANEAKGRIDNVYENYKAGFATDPTTGKLITEKNHPLSELAKRSEVATRRIAVSGLAAESAKRIQQENLEKALAPEPKAGSTEIPRSKDVIEAAGIDGERGIGRAQAYAKTAIDKRLGDEIAARVVLYDSTTDPSHRIGHAVSYLEEAIAKDDVVGARAAMKMLLTSGAPGKMKLHKIINEIKPGDDRNVVMSMKNGMLVEGVKSADVTLDRWAINKDSKLSLADIAKNASTYEGLNPEDLAGQNKDVLDTAFAAGAINKDVADSVLTNEQASRKLSPIFRKWFQDISDGNNPGILDK